MKEHSQNIEVGSEYYLRKQGKQYLLYKLGRNGEPLAKNEITVIATNFEGENGTQELLTDKEGKINLGELPNIK